MHHNAFSWLTPSPKFITNHLGATGAFWSFRDIYIHISLIIWKGAFCFGVGGDSLTEKRITPNSWRLRALWSFQGGVVLWGRVWLRGLVWVCKPWISGFELRRWNPSTPTFLPQHAFQGTRNPHSPYKHFRFVRGLTGMGGDSQRNRRWTFF